jgi:hypothetical protein
MPAFCHGSDLHSEDLDPVAYDGHTLGTALGGSVTPLVLVSLIMHS